MPKTKESKEVMSRLTGNPVPCECCARRVQNWDNKIKSRTVFAATTFNEQRLLWLCSECTEMTDTAFWELYSLRHTPVGDKKVVDGQTIKGVYPYRERIVIRTGEVYDCSMDIPELLRALRQVKFAGVKSKGLYHLSVIEPIQDAGRKEG